MLASWAGFKQRENGKSCIYLLSTLPALCLNPTGSLLQMVSPAHDTDADYYLWIGEGMERLPFSWNCVWMLLQNCVGPQLRGFKIQDKKLLWYNSKRSCIQFRKPCLLTGAIKPRIICIAIKLCSRGEKLTFTSCRHGNMCCFKRLLYTFDLWKICSQATFSLSRDLLLFIHILHETGPFHFQNRGFRIKFNA